MEIIEGEEGWYILIDMPEVGFAESKWYLTKAELVKAVLNNNVKWHSKFETELLRKRQLYYRKGNYYTGSDLEG